MTAAGSVGISTRDKVVETALAAFGRRGYETTSLDSLARELGIRKQTILYYFPSKEALLAAVVDEAAHAVAAVLGDAVVDRPAPVWVQVRAVVRAVFRLAGRRPELLGLLREVTRLGPPSATRFAVRMGPLIDRATTVLEEAMAAGDLREQDARLLLLMAYSTVVGVATEVEVLRALGLDPTARSLVRQRSASLSFLRAALLPEG